MTQTTREAGGSTPLSYASRLDRLAPIAPSIPALIVGVSLVVISASVFATTLGFFSEPGQLARDERPVFLFFGMALVVICLGVGIGLLIWGLRRSR